MTLPITITRPEITPSRAHPDDAGLDLRADIDMAWTIQPGCRELVPTGVSIRQYQAALDLLDREAATNQGAHDA